MKEGFKVILRYYLFPDDGREWKIEDSEKVEYHTEIERVWDEGDNIFFSLKNVCGHFPIYALDKLVFLEN